MLGVALGDQVPGDGEVRPSELLQRQHQRLCAVGGHRGPGPWPR